MDAMTRGLLADGHEVKVLSIATEKHPWCSEDVEPGYIEQTSIETVHVDTRVNRVDAFANPMTGDSYNISRFHSPEFEQLLIHVLQRNVFDLVLFESLFTAPYLPIVRNYCDGPLVLRAHNVEHRIWELMAEETEAFTKRMYLQHLAERLKAYEVNALHDFDAIAAISTKDKENFEALGCTCPVFTLPRGREICPVNHRLSVFNVIGYFSFLRIRLPSVPQSAPTFRLAFVDNADRRFLFQALLGLKRCSGNQDPDAFAVVVTDLVQRDLACHRYALRINS